MAAAKPEIVERSGSAERRSCRMKTPLSPMLEIFTYLVSRQWADRERSKFPLTAHASFCNPRSPLRSRSAVFFHAPLPLSSRSFNFRTRSAPAKQGWARNEISTAIPMFWGCPTQLFYRRKLFQLQIQDGGRKTKTRTTRENLYTINQRCNLPVIARFRGIADSWMLMSLLLVLGCIGKSNIAAAKPEIHI